MASILLRALPAPLRIDGRSMLFPMLPINGQCTPLCGAFKEDKRELDETAPLRAAVEKRG
jgi:hypothetical protein